MADELKIEDGVPAPPPGKRGPTKYPWNKMAPGQSFLVECGRTAEDLTLTSATVRAAANRYGRKHGMRFQTATRRERVDGERGVRVWRIE
jgi:hypothetical protein